MLAVVVADAAVEGEFQFEGETRGRRSRDGIYRAVLEAGTPKPGGARNKSGTLHLCQAKSNRARCGRKNDFADAGRLIKRLVAQELVLSFVPDPEQRPWRGVSGRRMLKALAEWGNRSGSVGRVADHRDAHRATGTGGFSAHAGASQCGATGGRRDSVGPQAAAFPSEKSAVKLGGGVSWERSTR